MALFRNKAYGFAPVSWWQVFDFDWWVLLRNNIIIGLEVLVYLLGHWEALLVSVTQLAASVEPYCVDVPLSCFDGDVLIAGGNSWNLEFVKKWNVSWHQSLVGISDSKFTIGILTKCEDKWVQVAKLLRICLGLTFWFNLVHWLTSHVLEIIAPTILFVAHLIYLL